MKRNEQEQWLNELLSGDELTSLRRTSLELGLGLLQRRRARRRQLTTCALVVMPLIFLALALASVLQSTRHSQRVVSVPAQVAGIPAPRAVKFITDQELLALFPDRPIALVGKPGAQQLVFLDRSSNAPR